MPLLRDRPVRIQPYFGFRSETRLHLQARALRSRIPSFENAGRWRAMRTMLAQYASREAAGVDVTLELASPAGRSLKQQATSDVEGFVSFNLDLGSDWPLPDDPAWESARISWENGTGIQSAAAHVLAPGKQSDLAIISDIDDTIIETGISGSITAIARNWRRLLAQWPEERIAVPGADAFYAALGGGAVPAKQALGQRLPATHRPFFYVSSSPWNLFSYLVAFKHKKGLPLGPLLLRDWGFNRQTLGSSSHGSHKSDRIRQIMALYPQLRFALIGDDTQGDLAAFASIASQHEGRIGAIFIRRLATRALNDAENRAVSAIRACGIPLWMGASYSAGHEFLQSLGLDHDGEAETIVEALQEQEAGLARDG